MRTIEEIYGALMDDYARRAGFRPEAGCDLAVRLYAAAAQVQALETQAEWVLDQSFPQTAQGQWLDSHAQIRGISRAAAARAVGTLRFSVTAASTADLTIPEGTVCMTAREVSYRTTREVVLRAGQLTVDAPAESVEAGAHTNAAAGTIAILTACPVGITGCTNPAAFFGGTDTEDDESLRRRVLESYRRLPNGANAAWYEQTAMSHEGVAAAQAHGRARGVGTVDVYIAAESGIPEGALLTEVEEDLQVRREIAVDVKAKAPTIRQVDVACALAVKPGAVYAEVKNRVEQAVRGFFTGRMLGRPVYLAELRDRIYDVEGVENYRLTAPAADLAAQVGGLPQLGTLTLTEMEG